MVSDEDGVGFDFSALSSDSQSQILADVISPVAVAPISFGRWAPLLRRRAPDPVGRFLCPSFFTRVPLRPDRSEGSFRASVAWPSRRCGLSLSLNLLRRQATVGVRCPSSRAHSPTNQKATFGGRWLRRDSDATRPSGLSRPRGAHRPSRGSHATQPTETAETAVASWPPGSEPVHRSISYWRGPSSCLRFPLHCSQRQGSFRSSVAPARPQMRSAPQA